MSWKLGLNIGASFAELSAQSGNQLLHKRWFMPKQSLVEGLRAFLQEHPQINSAELRVCSQLADWVLEKRMGANFAWLCTAGFEGWARLNLPFRRSQLSLEPKRAAPLLDKDLVFGIGERVDSRGGIVKPLQIEELEFLVTKLELASVKEIAVGFLHSHLNAKHEKMVAQFFSGKGFRVRCSSDYPSSDHDELARWRLSILDSYVNHDLLEQRERTAKLKSEIPQITQVQFCDFHGSFFLSQFAWVQNLSDGPIFHCGLERFLLLDSQDTQTSLACEFGTLDVTTPKLTLTSIQPTQVVQKGPWNVPEFGEKQLGFEPGPMLLGKSLVPTFLDILFLLHGSESLGFLSGLSQEKSEKRILETLFTMAKDQLKNQDLDSRAIAQSLSDVAVNSLVQQILLFSPDKSVLCTGPLAPLMSEKLRAQAGELLEVSCADHGFTISTALAAGADA